MAQNYKVPEQYKDKKNSDAPLSFLMKYWGKDDQITDYEARQWQEKHPEFAHLIRYSPGYTDPDSGDQKPGQWIIDNAAFENMPAPDGTGFDNMYDYITYERARYALPDPTDGEWRNYNMEGEPVWDDVLGWTAQSTNTWIDKLLPMVGATMAGTLGGWGAGTAIAAGNITTGLPWLDSALMSFAGQPGYFGTGPFAPAATAASTGLTTGAAAASGLTTAELNALGYTSAEITALGAPAGAGGLYTMEQLATLPGWGELVGNAARMSTEGSLTLTTPEGVQYDVSNSPGTTFDPNNPTVPSSNHYPTPGVPPGSGPPGSTTTPPGGSPDGSGPPLDFADWLNGLLESGILQGLATYLTEDKLLEWYEKYLNDPELRKIFDPFGDQRQQYQFMLSDLMSDPESYFAKDPGFQFMQNEGLRAAQHSAGPGGRQGSSNAASWALDRALGNAAQYRQQEAQLLGHLGGADISPSSYAQIWSDAFKGAGEAQAGKNQAIGAMISALTNPQYKQAQGQQSTNANLANGNSWLGKFVDWGLGQLPKLG